MAVHACCPSPSTTLAPSPIGQQQRRGQPQRAQHGRARLLPQPEHHARAEPEIRLQAAGREVHQVLHVTGPVEGARIAGAGAAGQAGSVDNRGNVPYPVIAGDLADGIPRQVVGRRLRPADVMPPEPGLRQVGSGGQQLPGCLGLLDGPLALPEGKGNVADIDISHLQAHPRAD
jgi:hypothetical protein